MKKALITGISGFVGSHLAQFLIEKNIKVFGFYYPNQGLNNLKEIKNKLTLYPVDLLEPKNLLGTIKKINPDYVFHLAATSSPSQSFKEPVETLKNNIFAQINLLDCLVQIKSKAKILAVASSEEYGDVQSGKVSETQALNPISPYAVSKVGQDFLAYQYFLHHGLHVIRVRPFNHAGPKQAPFFVVAAFAKQIAEIEKNGGGEIKVGNLKSYRDFTDVRDIVRAYYLALEKGKISQVYNIGSGKPVKIANILKMLISHSSTTIIVKTDKDKFLPLDIKKAKCDFSKFKKDTGWKPEIPFSTTLLDTLEYERTKIR